MIDYLNISAFILGITVGIIIIACIICGACWFVKDFMHKSEFDYDIRNYLFEVEQGTGRNVTAEVIEKIKERNNNVF